MDKVFKRRIQHVNKGGRFERQVKTLQESALVTLPLNSPPPPTIPRKSHKYADFTHRLLFKSSICIYVSHHGLVLFIYILTCLFIFIFLSVTTYDFRYCCRAVRVVKFQEDFCIFNIKIQYPDIFIWKQMSLNITDLVTLFGC